MIRLAAVLALLAGPVWAQENCAPKELVWKRLFDEYGESRLYSGLGSTGAHVFEYWGNEETGTWTILRTDSEITCLMASGQYLKPGEVTKTGVPL